MALTEYPPLSTAKLTLIESVSEAQEFLRWLSERRPHNAIGFDIETGERRGEDPKDALSPWRGEIRLAQIGDGEHGWAFSWDRWKGVFYEALTDYDGLIVMHNMNFETKWMTLQSEFKLPWDRLHDTMIQSQVIDPLGTHSLKGLAERKVDYLAANLQDTLHTSFKDNGWTWGTVPINFPPYWQYSALDPVITMRLFDQYWPLVGPGGKYHEPYELEMNARRIATHMELSGARVDLDYSQKTMEGLEQKAERITEDVKKQYGGALVSSNPQMVRVFESLDAEFTQFTPGGSKSIAKDQLALFAIEGNPAVQELAKTIIEQRKAEKLAGSFFKNFIDFSIDGIVHPDIFTMGARTGRMSIRDPALQTLPSGDALVRRAFIPKEEGFALVSCDLDQVEFRLTASFSGDQQLISLFYDADNHGGDVFTDIMRNIYHDPSLTKASPRRKAVKTYIYGTIYGAGVDKSAINAGVPLAEMRELAAGFNASYPGVKALQRRVTNQAQERLRNEGQAYIYTRTGRRLPGDSDKLYALTNYLIQGSAAEIFKMNLVKMDMAGLLDYMLLPVHDEILLDAPLEDIDDIMHTTKECMTTETGWTVPLPAGIDGPLANWGSKYDH